MSGRRGLARALDLPGLTARRQVLDKNRDKVDAMLALVGDALQRSSVVGSSALRDVWSVRVAEAIPPDGACSRLLFVPAAPCVPVPVALVVNLSACFPAGSFATSLASSGTRSWQQRSSSPWWIFASGTAWTTSDDK
jgi:hypothetical protein